MGIISKTLDAIDKLNEQHQQEMKEVTTALNNNTLALQKLSDVSLWEMQK